MKQMSLRNKLIFTVIPLLIITITALVVISYWQFSRAIMSQNTDYLEQIVQNTVEELTFWIEEREREITLLSQEAVLQNACLGQNLTEAQQRLTSYHQRSPVYEALFLTDPRGVVVMNSTQQQIGLDLAQMPQYAVNIAKAQQRQIWIGTVEKSPDSGRPVVLITAPIIANSQLIGVIGTPLELNYFSERRINPQNVGKDGYFAMIDATGKFLAHPDQERILTEFDLGHEVLAQKQGQKFYHWQGAEKMMQLQTNARTGWVVMATITKDELFREIDRVRNIGIWLAVGCIVVVSLTIWRVIVKNLVAPIRATVEYVKKVSAGDISETLEVTRQDELGELLQAMSQMIMKLRQVVSDVKGAAENVASGSQALSSGSQEMSNGATEQAAAGEEASSSMEQMAANIRQNADNATQTEKIATKAANDAQKSGDAVAQTVTAMREIVRKITIIEEIARQTHTLSLNATIEAAKAQEYGKGFAVVAAEVRALASRSQDASSEINQIASQSIDIAERAGDMLTKLVPDIQHTAELVQEIGAASREQSTGTEQINRAIQQLDSVTQQNASISEEMAATAEELASQAEQLQQTIAFFRVGETDQQSQDNQGYSQRKRTTVAHLKDRTRLQPSRGGRTDQTEPPEGSEAREKGAEGDRLDSEFERY